MAAVVLTPDYSILQREQAMPSPLERMAKEGLQAYGQVSQIKRQNAMAQLAQQQEQRQQAQAAQEQQVRELQIYGAKSKILQNRMADLYQTPKDQKEAEYQSFRNDAQKLGIDTSQFPKSYNDEIAAKSATAYARSPQSAEERKFHNDIALQHLKGQAQLAAAQARAQTQADVAEKKAQLAAQDPSRNPFLKQQQTDFAKYTNQLSDDAQTEGDHVLPLYQKLKAQIKKVPTNPVSGKILWATPEGQRLNQLLVLAQGDAIKQFHLGRMTQYEFNIIRQGVGKGTMYNSTLNKVFDDRLDKANETIRKNKFAKDYVKAGGRSPLDFADKWAADKTKRQEADIEYTARTHGMTVEQVKQQLGVQ
jgi:hypothetical protein